MGATKNLARYVQENSVNLSAMSRETGIPYMALHDSLANKKRARLLSFDEALVICRFLGVNPMDFAEKIAIRRRDRRDNESMKVHIERLESSIYAEIDENRIKNVSNYKTTSSANWRQSLN